MATDLETVVTGSDMVGVVDHPGGEPQHLPLQLRQALLLCRFHCALREMPAHDTRRVGANVLNFNQNAD